MTVLEAIMMLDNLVDESDPDVCAFIYDNLRIDSKGVMQSLSGFGMNPYLKKKTLFVEKSGMFGSLTLFHCELLSIILIAFGTTKFGYSTEKRKHVILKHLLFDTLINAR